MSIMMERYLRAAGISTPMGRVLDKALSEASDHEWGIRWQEFGQNDRVVTKEKFFPTQAARDKFADQVEKKDNFKSIEAWSDPKTESRRAKARSIRESNDAIARDVMKLYNVGQAKDWDMGDVDDVIEKYLPHPDPHHHDPMGDDPRPGDLKSVITRMDPHQAEKMWHEILPLKKQLEDQLDPDDVEEGDLVDFGGYGKLYVVKTDDHDKYFWVTRVEKDRFDPHARGNTILKSLAQEIIEPASDVDPDDYDLGDDIDESRVRTESKYDTYRDWHQLPFLHVVDADERGEYRAHIEDINGDEVMSYGSDDDGEVDMVTDGFMRNTDDMRGLLHHLQQAHVLPHNAVIYNKHSDFERAVEKYNPEDES